MFKKFDNQGYHAQANKNAINLYPSLINLLIKSCNYSSAFDLGANTADSR